MSTPLFLKALDKYDKICYNNHILLISRRDGIGRRDGLKIRWGNTRAGSTPAAGTTSRDKL